jgi:hypothetical protein
MRIARRRMDFCLVVVTELAGGVSTKELAARAVSRQTGQVPGLGWSILDEPPTGTPGNVATMM